MVAWTVDHEYPQISIREGSGLLFKWSGSTPHDLVEMSSPLSTFPDCTFVGSSAHSLGKVYYTYIQAIRMYSGTFYCDVGRQERPNFNKRLCRHSQLLFNLQRIRKQYIYSYSSSYVHYTTIGLFQTYAHSSSLDSPMFEYRNCVFILGGKGLASHTHSLSGGCRHWTVARQPLLCVFPWQPL